MKSCPEMFTCKYAAICCSKLVVTTVQQRVDALKQNKKQKNFNYYNLLKECEKMWDDLFLSLKICPYFGSQNLPFGKKKKFLFSL